MTDADTFTELRSLVPKGSLSLDHEALEAARRYGLSRSGLPPECILHPANADELGEVIRYANAAGLNLTVTSSASPHHRGGITSLRKHVLIDLSHWKRIEGIDRRNRVCRLEPGVTYGELISALSAHGMTLPLPLSPRAGKSVLAAVMDREPGTWPNKQWDSGDPVCSTEFFFGSGERFRTG